MLKDSYYVDILKLVADSKKLKYVKRQLLCWYFKINSR